MVLGYRVDTNLYNQAVNQGNQDKNKTPSERNIFTTVQSYSQQPDNQHLLWGGGIAESQQPYMLGGDSTARPEIQR